MAPQDSHIRSTGYIRRLDVAQLADREHLNAHQPQVNRRIHECDRQNNAFHALPEHGHKRNCEYEHRKRLEHVGRPHHDRTQCTTPRTLALVIADQRTDGAANCGGEQGTDDGDGKIDTRREQDAAEDVHAGSVGTQYMVTARRQEVHARIGMHRPEWRQPGGEQRDRNDGRHDRVADGKARL